MGMDDLDGVEAASTATRLGLAPQLLDKVLEHFIRTDGLEVVYPNGAIIEYGDGRRS